MTKGKDKTLQYLSAQAQALEHLQSERAKLNEFIKELREDYISAGDPLKIEIEKKAEDALIKLNNILEKLKQMA